MPYWKTEMTEWAETVHTFSVRMLPNRRIEEKGNTKIVGWAMKLHQPRSNSCFFAEVKIVILIKNVKRPYKYQRHWNVETQYFIWECDYVPPANITSLATYYYIIIYNCKMAAFRIWCLVHEPRNMGSIQMTAEKLQCSIKYIVFYKL